MTDDTGPGRDQILTSDLILVHEVPGRLRFRSPTFTDSKLDPAWLESWVEALSGVQAARVNRPARSLVVEYEGGDSVRHAVINRVDSFSLDAQPADLSVEDREAEIAPMITTAATLAVLPFLTPSMRTLLTFVNVGSTLAKGADTLINEGVKMEVLDALAVGLAAGTGELYTANITNFMLDLGGTWSARPSANRIVCCASCCGRTRPWPGLSATESSCRYLATRCAKARPWSLASERPSP